MGYRTPDSLCGVYKIVNNVNGKVYIGQSVSIQTRWKEHINSLKRGDSRCTLLQRAWNKYGEENFAFEILELCTEDMLDEIEIKYIEMYNSHTQGYNIESGGNRHKHLAEETKRKIGDANRGRRHTEDSKAKMSQSRIGENNGMYGKHHSEEARKKMSNSKKGKPGRPQTDAQKERSRLANLGKPKSEETRRKISEAIKGRIPYNKNPRPVYCIELNQIFETASDAGKSLKIHSGNIINCCEHVRKTCGGFCWIYADSDEYNDFIKQLTIQN